MRLRETAEEAVERALLLASDTMRLHGVRAVACDKATENVFDKQSKEWIRLVHFSHPSTGLVITVNTDTAEVTVKQPK